MTYGPSTPQIKKMLEQTRTFGPATWRALEESYQLTCGTGEYLLVRMSSDFARERLHETLTRTGLSEPLNDLWTVLRPPGEPLHRGYWSAHDAIAATLLAQHLSPQGFTQADYDCLLAPWRAVVDHCARSRTFLSAAPRWPYPAEGLWEVVDAILATPG